MEGTYEVFFEGKPVGTVVLSKQGLYYRVCCRCEHVRNEMFDLVAHMQTHRDVLGLLVPMDGGIGLDKKIPIKRMGNGNVTFTLTGRNGKGEDWISVDPEKEFPYLQDLDRAYLAPKGNDPGIAFRKNKEEKGKNRG